MAVEAPVVVDFKLLLQAVVAPAEHDRLAWARLPPEDLFQRSAKRQKQEQGDRLTRAMTQGHAAPAPPA